MSGNNESLGGDPGGVLNESALNAVSSFMHSMEHTRGDVVTRFVLLVETIDEDDRWLSAFTAPDQKRWDTMGLLDYALTMERNIRFDGTLDPEDDE